MTTATLSDQKITPYMVDGSFLIIGYGNPLRGDDAAGAKVADIVANWNLPKVKAIALHQLMPELAIEISRADYVIFVDACGEESCARSTRVIPLSANGLANLPVDRSPNRYRQSATAPVSAARSTSVFTHHHSAEGLLVLTRRVYGYAPPAWLLQLPAESFVLGEQLSATAQRGIDEATRTIERFLVHYQSSYPVTTEPCMKSA